MSQIPSPNPADRDPNAVRTMFDRVARRYDLVNHFLSGGLDFWWRHQAAQIVRHWRPRKVLDLATGSGDLALAIAQASPQAEVTGADFSSEMLAVARRKGLTNTMVADALQLPLPANTFDVVTVAFGLRNMADWGIALREMARVLAPTGHLLVLDFSLPRGLFGRIYRGYLNLVLPRIAGVVTGEQGAYKYLGESIEQFPQGRAMCELIDRNGFVGAQAKSLSGGIVTIYLATKT